MGGPIRLYRGAHPDYRDGWSWTPYIELAAAFANRSHRFVEPSRPVGEVWQADVEPHRLLARYNLPDWNCDAYVVDTAGLTIAPVRDLERKLADCSVEGLRHVLV